MIEIDPIANISPHPLIPKGSGSLSCSSVNSNTDLTATGSGEVRISKPKNKPSVIISKSNGTITFIGDSKIVIDGKLYDRHSVVKDSVKKLMGLDVIVKE